MSINKKKIIDRLADQLYDETDMSKKNEIEDQIVALYNKGIVYRKLIDKNEKLYPYMNKLIGQDKRGYTQINMAKELRRTRQRNKLDAAKAREQQQKTARQIQEMRNIQQQQQLQKIREHLNSSLGLNLSEKSVRYLYTPPGEEDG